MKQNIDIDTHCYQQFLIVTEDWQLSAEEKSSLLGDAEKQSINDTNNRVKNVIMIHNVLHLLFPNTVQANSWVRKPNKYFNGNTALSVMLEGNGLERVLKYLNAQRN